MLPERKLVLSRAFEKSYKKFTSNNSTLKAAIFKTLDKLQGDIGTHNDVY